MNIQQPGLISNDSATSVLKSVCRSCHGGCGVLLHVRDGVLLKVEGDRDSPLNHGRLCPIGTVTTDLVYHPDRLKYPLRRKGKRQSGEWERISWDDALDEISQRLLAIREQYGPEAIALGTGTGRHHIRWVSRFGHALGTPNWCEPGFAQCFHPRVNTSILTFGDFPVSDYTGEVPPACILFWGHNPVLSGPDGETRFNVMEALAHNPRTIVVDPRRTALAEKADLWLQIRPGADDALALAMLNVIIGEKLYDEPFVTQWTHGFAELAAHVKEFTPEWAEPITWIAADKIRAAARLFAQHQAGLAGLGLRHRTHAEMHPDHTRRLDAAGAHRQYRRAGRLGVRHAWARPFPEPDREPHARGECQAARRRSLQAARRGGRRLAGRAYPDAAARRCARASPIR